MRKSVIDREFTPLQVNEKKLQFVGRVFLNHARQHGVQKNGLSGIGCPRNENMLELGEFPDDIVPVKALSDGKRERT